MKKTFENFINSNQERFKLWFVVLFGLGIGSYFLFESEPSKWVTLGAIEALILLAILFRHYPLVLKSLLVPAFVVAGFANIQVQTIYRAENQVANIPQGAVYIKAQIVEVNHNIKGNPRLILQNIKDFDGKKIDGTFRVTLRDKTAEFKSGQCVEAVVKLQPLAQAVMVGGYQFDRKNFYDGLSGSGYSTAPVYQTDCPSGEETSASVLTSLRERINQHIRKVLPQDNGAIVEAIVTGEQSQIPEKIINNYRDSGLAHFLSISGLHMSMIAGLMFFLSRLLLAFIPAIALRFDSKKISAVLAIIVSAAYLGISGAQVPATRAFVMTFIVLLGVLFNRRAISMYTIAVAAALILVLYPEALVGPSFQMSFAAVVCLIAFYERFAKRLKTFVDRSDRNLLIKIFKILLLYFVGILASDTVASLATTPFAIYHFNRVALYTSLANLMAGPIIGFIIMPFVLLALLLMPLGLSDYPLQVVGYGIDKVNEITAWVSSLDGATYLLLSEPMWGFLSIVFGGLWLCLWQDKIRHLGWLGLIVGCLSIATVQKPDIMINADASVIALKDNQNNLVVLPSRGKGFIKDQWLGKTASKKLSKEQNERLKEIYKGKETDKEWLDLQCDKDRCLYKKKFQILKGRKLMLAGKVLNLQETGGVSIYMGKELKVETVREDIGNRLWNSIPLANTK